MNIPNEIAEPALAVGLDPAVVMAVAEVESGGRWLHRDGPASLPVLGDLPADLPYILFEPHVFWRRVSLPGRADAVAQGLAYRRQGEQPYPARQIDRWGQLSRAMQIDPEAACAACSWGVGQVLGENATWLSYGSAVEMAQTIISGGVEAQTEAMLRFIDRKAGARQALAARDWTTFARLYNGAGHAKNGYAGKLERAYRRIAGQPSPVVLRIGDRGTEVRRLQQALDVKGFYDGPVDGAFGPGTEAAVRRFQEARGLAVDGVVGARTWAVLATAGDAPAPQPVDTPEADVVATVGKAAAGGGLALGGAVEIARQAGELLDVANAAATKLPSWVADWLLPGLALGAVLGLGVWGGAALVRRWQATRTIG